MSPDPALPSGEAALRRAAAAALARAAALGGGGRLGVAVSGGGDSLALLVALHEAAEGAPGRLAVVSIDHGLRPEAAEEIAAVAALCARLGLAHHGLQWRGWAGRGNLQDAARRARAGLIADWARAQGIGAVALGHTVDDQAETLLMRLARGAGVEGLSAMAPARRAGGVLWLRPFLGLTRAELRAFLQARGLSWADDPSNEDTRFQRVRARQALAALAPVGLEPAGLAQVAAHLGAARAALAHHACATAREIAQEHAGAVFYERAAFLDLPDETARRLIAAALRVIAGPGYAPRGAALGRALAALREGQRAHTLQGAVLFSTRAACVVAREPGRLGGVQAAPGALWDGRWQLVPPAPGACAAGAHVAALGDAGLAACAQWRATGLPRLVLAASPALWQGGRLLAAPLAGHGAGWRARLAAGWGGLAAQFTDPDGVTDPPRGQEPD